MNNYKSFSELKEELGDNYDFKLYEMGISALKEIEQLQEENQQLKMIIEEYERLNKENGRGFKITSVKQYNIDELIRCEDNWNKLKEYIDIKLYNVEYLQNLCGCRINDETHMILNIIKEEMQEIEQGSDDK